jgi:hypothetical protein
LVVPEESRKITAVEELSGRGLTAKSSFSLSPDETLL